jgi:hypothetical protein
MDTTEQQDQHAPREELVSRVADAIRQDSQERGKLTLADSLAPHFEGLEPQEAESIFGILLDSEAYEDITALQVPSGSVYLYSSRHVVPERAKMEALIEAAGERLAARVRAASQQQITLTAVGELGSFMPEFDADQIDAVVAHLLESKGRYADIQAVTAATGAVYLYSERHITGNYAQLLARVEAGDPLATIAETVRDESRIYPRPTHVRLFTQPPFGLKPDQIDEYVDALLQEEGYQDIQRIRAQTGAVYLYSTKHLSEALARSMVYSEEVERYENP